MKRREILALAPAALLLTSCGPDAAEKAAAEKAALPAEPITGLRALYQMYGMARNWAPDVKVLRIASINVSQVKPQPGKSGAWQTIFASEAKAQKRAFTTSVFDVSVTLRKGTFPDTPSQWVDDKRAVAIAQIHTDTDKAFEVAMAHGGDYARKNPTMPISYLLELDRNVNLPMWRVIWGQSVGTSTFSVLIEAASGTFMAKQG
ncbi:MAG: hypothetical protein JWN34_3190 [Bryobacterales bacterium]|nr:hypothetical protein [Bryobacterales bacterium]